MIPDVVSIQSVKVAISWGKDTIHFSPVKLSTSFRIQAIPQCSCTLFPWDTSKGIDQSTSDGRATIQKVLEAYSKYDLSISVSIELYMDSKKTTIEIFKGIVTNIAETYSMSSYGESSYALSVSAVHTFANLFRLGCAGMYPVQTSNDLSLGSNLRAKASEYTGITSTYGNDTTAHSIISHMFKGNRQSSPTSTIIWELVKALAGKSDIHEINKGRAKPLIGGDNIDPKNPLIVGDAIPYNPTSDGHNSYYELILSMLKTILRISSTNTTGDGILKAIKDTNCGLIIAPRSVDTVSLIPDYGAMFNSDSEKGLPYIPTDMISGLTILKDNTVYPRPDGVIISTPGAGNTYDVPGGDKPSPQNPVLYQVYPGSAKASGEASVKDKKGRYMNIIAPTWISMSNDSSSNKQVQARAYAAMMYSKIRNINNSITINTDIRGILGFKALGSAFVVPGVSTEDIAHKGRLDSYSVNYSTAMSGGKSSLTVSLTLTYVEPIYDYEGSILSQDMCLYDIEKINTIEDFPTIGD